MAEIPSQEEVLSWFDRLSNWGRWGEGDRLGTLNHVTPARRAAAAKLVREGVSVSCAWDVDPVPAVDQIAGPPQRFMISSGEEAELRHVQAGSSEAGCCDHEGATPPVQRWGGASEWVSLAFHGYSVTHLDALSHYFWDARMYGGERAARVSTRRGAEVHDVLSVAEGVVTRGVMIDVPAVRGVDWLEPGEGVFPEDLDRALERQGTEVRSGDAVLLRTGYGRRKRERGPDDTAGVGRAGWHVACIPWLHDHDVALIGCDTAQDVHPSGYEAMRSPVHAVGIVALGLWLLDNCDLEPLAATCERLGRWEFLFQLAPLRIRGATGSPVNPIALF